MDEWTQRTLVTITVMGHLQTRWGEEVVYGIYIPISLRLQIRPPVEGPITDPTASIGKWIYSAVRTGMCGTFIAARRHRPDCALNAVTGLRIGERRNQRQLPI
jgi:hypothetical protein